MKTTITDKLNRIVGFIDEDTYYTTRDGSKNQIFLHPKYLSAVGLSIWIIRRLLKANVKKLDYFILNWDKEPFHALISLQEFLEKSKDYQAKGNPNTDKQKILSLGAFQRLYLNQMRLR